MPLPGFDSVRVPVRFAMLMALCLAIAAGLGLSALLPVRRRWRIAVAVLVCAGLWIDGAIEPLLGSAPPGRVELPRVPAAAVLELPPDDANVSVDAMFRSMRHRLPLINGYSGHIPRHYEILTQSLRRNDPSAVLELARGRTLLLLVAQRNDPTGHFRRLVESLPGVRRGEVTGAGVAYVLPAQSSRPRPVGRTIHPYTTTLLPREHAVLDLQRPRVIRVLEFPLRGLYRSLGRQLAVEVSDDGMNWTVVWNDFTGAAAVAGALEDQVRVPIRLNLPDVAARFLRIHPAPDWLLEQLRVIGP
jgi:hypothetical protein